MILPYSNLQVTHQNPGATMPLILPVHVICNTSDDDLFSNIRINSARPGDWLHLEEAHDGVAILCGSGPSLADTLDEIRALHALGGKVFAMNGAAKYLHDNGIMPDYQVILDAREETAQLVGPAKEHLFASQAHPACFEAMPSAKVWHLEIGDIEEHLPKNRGSFCLIGGAASVGNTSTCLAYAMGYRTLEIFGYDSSHRDTNGHAFHQKMNDGDPCASVRFGDKDYICSLTMKLQAEKFQKTAKTLEEYGCTINVHGSGLLPDMWRIPKERLTEQQKYERMYAYPEYNVHSPGERCAPNFITVVRALTGSTVIDFGCGTGRGGVALKEAGYDVTLVDFVGNSRSIAGLTLPFRQMDLTKPMDLKADYGYCTDVLEHIPPPDVDAVIDNIMACVPKCFFQISLIHEDMGESLIDCQLHLSVHSHYWWTECFKRLGYIIEWRDKGEIASMFLVSST